MFTITPLRFMGWLWLLAAVGIFAGLCFGYALFSTPSHQQAKPAAETIYIVNQAGGYISDAQILSSIPAWQQAANKDFAPAWHSPRVRLELVRRAPAGSIVAYFRKDGPVQGALAYHSVSRGVPFITVYAGVGNFYGYSNSVSFTHELFELLADENINSWNWHWQSEPNAYYVGQKAHFLPSGAFWFNEVCDPVEAYAYSIHHVQISDFITPNWFGDQVNGPFDQMNLVHLPLQTLRGGYSQFETDGYHLVQFFRGAGRDADGFLKAEEPFQGSKSG